jgi:hypothetical protein
MDDSQLLNAIEAYESNAETYGNLQEDRTDALDYYLGNPLGNEVEGRSQVIARTVWDTVEWLKPQLADIFCSGDELVSFQPRGPEDTKAAEQESDYVNHIITQRNSWFDVFYGWMHDALVQKNGYVKVYWDDSEDITCEYYDDLTDDEYAILMQDKDIEIIEHEEESEPMMDAMGNPVLDQMGMPVMVREHSVKLNRKSSRDVVKICNIAPEHIRVDHNARGLSLQDERVAFVQHAEYKTLTDLRLEGFDVPDDLADDGNSIGDWEEDLRDDYSPFRDRDGEQVDPAMRRVKVRESWVRFDMDGDGRAELRHVIVVGTKILHNEECEFIPIVALCPTPLPHQHYGLSVADAVMDLQRIQTALFRGALDNQYLANNGRYGVDENSVNLDDMLDSRPGGIVRFNGAKNTQPFFPLTHPTNGQIAIPMMEYVDRIAQKRTGVSDQTQGINPDVLNNQAGATANTMMLTAAQQRIKFIARVFAETGIKTLFQLVHQITLLHTRKAEMIRLRGEWVPIDPRTWVKRNDLQIAMTFGMGDRTSQVAVLKEIGLIQAQAMQIGLATPKNIYNTLARMVKTVGYKDVTEFLTDPETAPPKPPQVDPKIQLEQMKQQAEIHKFQATQQMEVQKFQAEQTMQQEMQRLKMEFEQRQSEMELQLQASNDARDSERESLKAQYESQIEQMRIENERQIKAMEDDTKRYIAELDARVKLIIAGVPDDAVLARDTQKQAAEQDAEMRRQMAEDARTEAMLNIQQQNQQMFVQLSGGLSQVVKQVGSMAESINRPKSVVRGPDGKIVGVQ